MIIDELTLHNVGVYAGRNRLVLTPPSESKPVVLIGALNGGGKTTLLDAIQLCLYGKKAQCSKRGGLAYEDFLSASIHRNAHERQASVSMTFRKTINGLEGKYELKRNWRETKSGCKETFEVWRDGKLDEASSANWLAQVDEFFPHNIAHLFLFDGEQIARYASQETSQELIRSAIHNLLGVDLIDKLDRDLTAYTRRKRSELKGGKEVSSLETMEQDLEQLNAEIDALAQQTASLRTHDLPRVQRELKGVADALTESGGDLFEKREELEKQAASRKREVSELRAQLRALASGDLPLLMLPNLLRTAKDQHERARDASKALSIAQFAEKARVSIVELLKGSNASQTTIQAVADHLSAEIEEHRSTASEQRLSFLDSEQAARTLHILNEGADSLVDQAERLSAQLQIALSDAERIEVELSNVPTEDQVGHFIARRNELRQELSSIEAQVSLQAEQLQKLHADRERLTLRIAKETERLSLARIDQEDAARVLKHAGRARSTLDKFRIRLVERHIGRIEDHVMKCFKALHRKAAMVSAVKIDPETFSVSLLAPNGRNLRAEEISAGESQLLAVAFLWGLAKASGLSLPTAIDTPLGRLDSQHRANLLERYFPNASHQVILLSTDEEIRESDFERMRSNVGRHYLLDYCDQTDRTTIKDGYFGLEPEEICA